MKKILSIVLSVLLVLSLAGCGSSKEVDIESLSKDLLSDVQFSTELKSITVDHYIDLPDGAQTIGYMSTGTSSEEVIIISCKKSDEVSDVAKQLEELLADQLDQAQKYQPDEAELLENSEVKQYGNVAVLCVTSDKDTADSIIKGYLG